ncbi:MAG: helix-turn-helix transcriptional regulator [Acidimicrobiaceae bacterium]|nr:helix-turn-helix transcriptional regulator [Acidimicrobiaceae bacterium]
MKGKASGEPSSRRQNREPSSQRERILEALASICAEHGSGAATIQAIVARAGTSKRTFYREFAGKEEALEAIADEFRDRVLEALTERPRSGEDRQWPDSLRLGVAALLETVAAEPEPAKVVFLEPSSGNRPAGELLIAEIFERSAESASEPPPSPAAARAARAGAQGLIVDQLIADRADTLPALLPELLYISLVPYVGQREALRRSQVTGESE